MRSTGLPHQAIVTEDEPTTLPRRHSGPPPLRPSRQGSTSQVSQDALRLVSTRRALVAVDTSETHNGHVSVLEHCHVWNEPGSRCVWWAIKWTAELLRKPAWWVLNQHLCVMGKCTQSRTRHTRKRHWNSSSCFDM